MMLLRQRRSLFVVLAVIAMLGAIWSYMLLAVSRHQTLDQRVQHVASQLKCPICQGESVATSPSTLAQNMRAIIRQQLQSGKSEQEVTQYFVDRYGEQIVWSPPWQGFALLAWLAPIVLLLAGMVLLFFTLRDWRAIASAPVISSAPITNDDELREMDEADLELDYQLGNISEADYNALRERHTRRALAALKSRYDREQELDEAIEDQLRKLKEQRDTATNECGCDDET